MLYVLFWTLVLLSRIVIASDHIVKKKISLYMYHIFFYLEELTAFMSLKLTSWQCTNKRTVGNREIILTYQIFTGMELILLSWECQLFLIGHQFRPYNTSMYLTSGWGRALSNILQNVCCEPACSSWKRASVVNEVTGSSSTRTILWLFPGVQNFVYIA